MIVFDIETGPLPDDILAERVAPFEAPPHPGEFDPASVKTGNIKDPAKIKEKIEAARELHEATVKRYEADVAAAKDAWWKDAKSKAALSPLTGRVLAIGYLSTDTGKTILDIDNDETVMLDRFWCQYAKAKDRGRKLVGHNIYGFDIPFLMRRCWLHDRDVPGGVIDRGRWIDSITLVDTMTLWGCGNRDAVKLDVLARAFGVGQKPEGIDGSMFSDLLTSDPELARKYLANDLAMTAAVAERMGVI